MADIKLPYIAWRQQPDGTGRPRFQPGPRERAIGFVNADLKHPDGRWFSLDETRGFAEARHAEILAQRASGKRLRRPLSPKGRTVEDLLLSFLQSGRFQRSRAEGGYADGTKADYRDKANLIIWKPYSAADRKAGIERVKEEFAQAPAAAITPSLISNDEAGGFYEYLARVRGRTTARNCIMVLSAAYKWQRRSSGWQLAIDNPCTQLGLKKPAPLVLTWSIEEVKAFVAFADHPQVNEPELADAVILALFSAQRPADVIAYDGVGTSDGVTRLVQSKRGKRVEVPQLPPLLTRLALMAERRAQRGYLCPELIVDSHTGRGFNQNTFEHRIAALRTRVVAGDEALGLAACPSIADKAFRHLRKTMLTWIKRAGARDNQFAAVSGHSLQSLPQVMGHYYTPGSEEAREAMTMVWAWMQQKGMKV